MNIAIIGQMASGKTTSSEYLVKKYGYTKISFADPIYWVVNGLHNEHLTPTLAYYKYLYPYIEPELPENKKNMFIDVIRHVKEKIPYETPKPRKQLQWLGTEGGREKVDDKIWIKILLERIKNNPDKKYVIDDVRFKNELNALKKAGFKIVKLKITKKVQKERLSKLYGKFDKNILKHGSEIEIKNLRGDIKINTALDIKKTHERLDKLVKEAA